MRKLALIMSLLVFCALPLLAQDEGENPEFCQSLITAAKNYCSQHYFACRVGRGTCPVACGFNDGVDPICDAQYDDCMDSTIPWYCGFWAY